jgi:ABC-type nitrate/sulfonate/bicarbonate transport system ATPase subunit
MYEYNIGELIFKIENVSLVYDKPILHDINLEIRNITRPGMQQGQVISLIGRSGIGKTQLFKIMAGLIQPHTGRVLVGENQQPVKPGEVGIIPQNYILFNHHTIYQNLKIGIDHSGEKKSDKQKKEIITAYANEFGLGDHLSKYPMQLSGGQRQRASIIQQILSGNTFILMDEPFSGLDLLVKDKVSELILKISTLNELNTLVIVSHDIPYSLALSDTAYILARDGEKGATITEKLDLVKMGYAWHSEITKDRGFLEMVDSIKAKL